MQFSVLASDYDGTLATNGELRSSTRAALGRLTATGRRTVLVTGRTLAELRVADIQRELFDAVVTENGAVVWTRESDREELLAPPITDEVVACLRARGITPLHIGRVIASTAIDQAAPLRAAISDLGLDLMLIPNKHSLMLLPPHIDKMTGLRRVLTLLGEQLASTVACGDAENDITMVAAAGCGVAVANALPELKVHADIVTELGHGEGVTEVIEGLIADDLATMVAERVQVRAG